MGQALLRAWLCLWDQGDDDAFQWLNLLRSSVDDASPTNILDLDKIDE